MKKKLLLEVLNVVVIVAYNVWIALWDASDEE